MYSLQYRPQMDHTQYPENGERRRSRRPPFSSYLLWSICGLYCRLYMAYVQLMYGPYMAYVLPIYGLYSLYFHICQVTLRGFLSMLTPFLDADSQRSETYMAIYGHIWSIYGHIWPYMAIYGHIWPIYGPYMAIYVHIWPYMGHIWPIYGHI